MRVLEIKSASFRAEQAALTGESQAVLKDIKSVGKKDAVITEKHNLLFSSTLVSNGVAIGCVVKTGMGTEIGKIQEDLDEDDEDSPLKKRLEEFGETLAKAIGIICILVWVINFRNFSDPAHGGFILGCLYYFKVAVALAVAAIPEGLPAVITTCLALGTRRMAKENAIVRKLMSVETLGCTSVICSDKTGTLTTNEMVVKQFFILGNGPSDIESHKVTGISYQPEGDVEGVSDSDVHRRKGFRRFIESMYLNNDARLLKSEGKITRNGLPTEAALKVLVEKLAKYDSKSSHDRSNPEGYGNFIAGDYEKLATLEFTRDRKSMSVVCKSKSQGKNVMFIKGAPDYLIKASDQVMTADGSTKRLSSADKEALTQKVAQMAREGLRTLAICYKEDCGELSNYNGPSHPAYKLLGDTDNFPRLEANPTIIGVVGIQDPARQEVAQSIQLCRNAGITVVMITGDIKETAETIGKEIGIVGASDVANSSFTGKEFEALSETKRKEILNRTVESNGGLLFSRTEPRHKKILIENLKDLGQIVAMTGDGVNDAPALKKANIGIAMGINGTEVAKESSDMVLADDNFATIVKAVEEGRAIFANMKAFIRYMISSNIGEVVSIFLSSLLGLPDGFNSIQLLWVNLVTDGLPATALSFNPPDPLIMSKKPRKADEPIINPFVFTRYIVIGAYVGFATVGIFVYWYMYYQSADNHTLVPFEQLSNWSECTKDWNLKVNDFGPYNFQKDPCSYFTIGKTKASTLSLTVLVMIEMFNAVNALSEDSSLLTVGLLANPLLLLAIALSVALHCVILYIPFFARIFGTYPLDTNDWLLVIAFSFPVIFVDEILKIFSRRRVRAEQAAMKKE